MEIGGKNIKRFIIIEFIRFLKRNNCYEAFVRNLRKREKYNNLQCFLKNKGVYDYVDDAFMWVGTDEGSRYWSIINTSWFCRLDELHYIGL